ncbi:MAG: 3-dehydroquinate synthase [Acidiferrobacteraceae bacterium]|nr:3-dehydroquinate synthase [Acidiferrobacteraceae bacterium]|tara:strand:+ start:448 stop:1521 length:1074 start_codon:yes stop_codon:yes gene_type:complete
MAVLNVDLADRSYPIYIDGGLLRNEALIREHIVGSEVMVITDEVVAPLYLDNLLSILGGLRVQNKILPIGEEVKCMETVSMLFDGMLDARCSRYVTVIALGGGVVGDIAGFVAACYQRGVPFLQIPTTLLSQVDSSVGGKTGVNHPLGKNMIGAFYQPRCVIADLDTLQTLESRQVSAGIAEIVKYGLIRDAGFFSWLSENIDGLLACDQACLEHAITVSCKIKSELVSLDERETSSRVLLNLGHTFGHAIETELGFDEWLHGEAIAAGMVLASKMSERLGWLCSNDVAAICDLLARAKLPLRAPSGMTANDFLRHMSRDKKVSDDRIRLVLLKSIGSAELISDYPDHILTEILNEL